MTFQFYIYTYTNTYTYISIYIYSNSFVYIKETNMSYDLQKKQTKSLYNRNHSYIFRKFT